MAENKPARVAGKKQRKGAVRNARVEPLGVVAEKQPNVSSEIPLRDRSALTTVEPDSQSVATREVSFPIVCLGASAGGVEALEGFIRNIKPNSGCAYIVVVHLSSESDSQLHEILKRFTLLPVYRAEEEMVIERDSIYVIPPDKDIRVVDSHFRLTPRDRKALHLPIDCCLRSMSDVSRDQSVAVILSGAGHDGSDGLRYIKKELGLVIAQEPSSAHFDSMPTSAINTGLVDYILRPEEMPERIGEYFHKFAAATLATNPSSDRATLDALQNALYLLRKHTGHDFSNYKVNTLLRRIQRRMGLHQIPDMAQYVRYMQENPQEVSVLFRELLIGVTSFFRDLQAWAIIKERVLPELLDNKPVGYTFRAWLPGTATGEEAYSLAILLQEYIEERNAKISVQIFATDINDEAVEIARAGIYPSSIELDLTEDRLHRFFLREHGHYRVNRVVRESLVFAPQNLIKDPPFTKLDLICCRNLLIYLDQELQQKIIPSFHFSLRSSGILFLGTSESVGEFAEMFQTLDSRWKLFRRREASTHNSFMDLSLRTRRQIPTPEHKEQAPTLVTLAEKSLLEHFAPPSVIVDAQGDILYVHGRTGKFLEPAPGRARMNIFEMAGEGLKSRLPALLRKGARKRVSFTGQRISSDPGEYEVNVTLEPLRGSSMEGLTLVSFLEIALQAKEPAEKKQNDGNSTYATELEKELEGVRESLQTTVEELETSNEELRSMNEEFQSTNEELQSANEELETSREEMQSLNEELATVNEELQEKIDNLMQMHENMKVYLDCLDLPTIFLDRQLRIRGFSKQARRLLSIMEQDVGRPLSDLATHLKNVPLAEVSKQVNETREPLELDVEVQNGSRYVMRILPYSDEKYLMEGVVITFVDAALLTTPSLALR